MRRYLVPGLLVACTLLVAFWIIASRRHAQPFKAFTLTYGDMAGYAPDVPGATIRPVPVTSRDPAEPNIAVFGIEWGAAPKAVPLMARLVHGYNMPMCMKIKGYVVEPVGTPPLSAQRLPLQAWRVTSSAGEVSLWVTTMIRADDFSATGVDVCSMAFPRIDIPDDPNWVPAGFTREDLKHPLRSLRTWARARWNASRTDLLTFLRLRQPAWASDELITYVTRSLPPSVTPAGEREMIGQVAAAHAALLKQLQAWRRARQDR